MRWLLGEISFALLTLVYKAWGRWWIDDEQCRTTATAIMQAAIWVARFLPPPPDPRHHAPTGERG